MAAKFFFQSLIPKYRAYAQSGRVVAFDTETTGFGSEDEVVQIAAIEYVNGAKSRTFMSYLKPSVPIGEEASQVNGITNEFLEANGRPPKEVLTEFVEFVGDNCLLVAHNLPFDLRMIYQGFTKYNVGGPGNTVFGCDTRDFVKDMRFNLPNHKLATCVEHFALDAANSHDAFDDTDACAKLFFKLVNVEIH